MTTTYGWANPVTAKNRQGRKRVLTETWNANPVWVAARCPGDGHESNPWVNGTTIECANCGRAMTGARLGSAELRRHPPAAHIVTKGATPMTDTTVHTTVQALKAIADAAEALDEARLDDIEQQVNDWLCGPEERYAIVRMVTLARNFIFVGS